VEFSRHRVPVILHWCTFPWSRSVPWRASRTHWVGFRQAQPAVVAVVVRPAGVWSRLSARFARCSTT